MSSETCPCGSGQNYSDCCRPFIKGEAVPPTAEALMRSRFVAFTQRRYQYLTDTSHPNKKQRFSSMQRQQLDQVSWKKLTIKDTEAGQAKDDSGMVHFVVDFVLDEKEDQLDEKSRFKKLNSRWYYWDALPPVLEKTENTPSKNAPCPCGSGKKYKRCCGAAG